jgi:hypothetical protein
MDVRHALVKSLLTIVSMVLLSVLSLPSFALTQTEVAKLLASDGAPYDGFGNSVSIDGDTAVIGTPYNDTYGWNAGAAYVFVRTGDVWIEQAKLLASDGDAVLRFGVSVSIDSETAVIGALGDSDYRTGAAYVFVRTGDVWTEQAKLTSYSALWDAFGGSVSVDGDTAVIGANGDDDNQNGIGAAYVFVRTGDVWSEQAKIVTSDYPSFDRFGDSVSVSGDTIIIGAPHDDRFGLNIGAAYVFMRTNGVWTEQAKLQASDGVSDNRFGLSVSVDGNTAVIGAPHDYDYATGSAYVYVRTGDVWTEQAKLLTSDGALSDFFGISVSVDDDTAVIGAHADGYYKYTGSAYVFMRNGDIWTEQSKLLSSDGASDNRFGLSVSVDGNTAIIGATGDDDNGLYAGAAYVFTTSDDVNIDIKPSKKPENVINLKKGKNLKVAIAGTADFDALQVDPSTVKFGPSEANPIRYKGKDYNKDGFSDLILTFRRDETGIACGDTEATLTGQTFPEPVINIAGSDSFTVEPCP